MKSQLDAPYPLHLQLQFSRSLSRDMEQLELFDSCDKELRSTVIAKHKLHSCTFFIITLRGMYIIDHSEM